MPKIYHVDSFTDKPFSGNPAGVCILEGAADDKWMQNVAKEMNLSETAFLYPEKNGYNLRWFAPDAEVDLCGHATLASAHIIWEKGFAEKYETLRFFTKSGDLTANSEDEWIQLNFPVLPEEQTDAPEEIIDALGIEPIYTGRNAFDYLVEVASEDELRAIQPDFSKLSKITTRGVCVTAIASSADCDFVSRLFAPAIGIPEDPVTGSTHCCLGPYWMKKLNKNNFISYQASERGGFLKVKVVEDRVLISGKAITVIESRILYS